MDPPISTVELTGKEIWIMMEENLEHTFSRDPYKQMGGYLKRCMDLNLYFKVENPEGHRIQELFIGGKKLEVNKTYKAAYVTSQGVPLIYGKNRIQLEIRAIDALKNFLEKNNQLMADIQGTVNMDPLLIISSFIAGGIFYILIDQFIIHQRNFGSNKDASAWAIFLAVAVDSFSDGLMIGTGVLISVGLGLLLSLGQVSADIPMGFVNIASFKNLIQRKKRLIINLAASLTVFVGATIGYFAIKGQPPILIFTLLAFTAGILLTVTIEEIIPQSHREGEARLATLAVIGGFALFALISTYIT